MLTLAVRPSKRLILLYSLLYGLSLTAIIVYGQSWPGFIFFIVMISVLWAGVLSLYAVCALKALTWLPTGGVELQFRKRVECYEEISVDHRGPKLIILNCKNMQAQRSVLCLADAFTGNDFGLLQRIVQINKIMGV